MLKPGSGSGKKKNKQKKQPNLGLFFGKHESD